MFEYGLSSAMFVPAVATGERVAVWRPGDADTEPRLRLLLPGTGKSVRARALSASFVPSVQQAAHQFPAAGHRPPRSSRAGRRARSTASPRAGASAGAAVVQPGEPSAIDAALARWRGYPGGGPVELERAQRLGLISGVTEVGEALVDLGCWRTRINNLPPGPDLVSALANRPDALAPVPVRDPDAALNVAVRAGAAGVGDRVVTGWANAVLESVTARSRVLSWLQAEQYTDLALLSRNYPGLFEMLPTEVAFALRSTEATAGSAISTARTMTSRLPGTLRALHQGLIDADHAMAMARGTGTTSDDIARQVEADLLPELTAPGSTITPEQLRRRVIRRVIALDPDGAPERHRVAAADRRITRWAEDDGMAGLKVLAPAQQIAAIWEAATALADTAKHPGDTRTLGARRVDALADVCATILDSLPAPSGADAGGGPSTQAGLAPGDCTCHADRQDERSPADAGDATGIGADQATGTADRDLDDPYGCHVGSCDVDSCDPADCDRLVVTWLVVTRLIAIWLVVTWLVVTRLIAIWLVVTRLVVTWLVVTWLVVTWLVVTRPAGTPKAGALIRPATSRRTLLTRRPRRPLPPPANSTAALVRPRRYRLGVPADQRIPVSAAPHRYRRRNPRHRRSRSRCPPGTDDDRTSWSSFPTPCYWASTTPANSSDTALSPPNKPDRSLLAASSNDCSAIPSPEQSWTTAEPATNRQTHSSNSSWPETALAALLAATNPPIAARSTTSTLTGPASPPAAPRPTPISTRNAHTTTVEKMAAASPTSETPTAPATGPPHSDGTTPCHRTRFGTPLTTTGTTGSHWSMPLPRIAGRRLTCVRTVQPPPRRTNRHRSDDRTRLMRIDRFSNARLPRSALVVVENPFGPAASHETGSWIGSRGGFTTHGSAHRAQHPVRRLRPSRRRGSRRRRRRLAARRRHGQPLRT